MAPLRLLEGLGVWFGVSFVEVVHVRLELSDVLVEEFGHGVFDFSGFIDLLCEGVHLAVLDFDASAEAVDVFLQGNIGDFDGGFVGGEGGWSKHLGCPVRQRVG